MSFKFYMDVNPQVPPDMLSMEVAEEPSLDVRETTQELDSRYT